MFRRPPSSDAAHPRRPIRGSAPARMATVLLLLAGCSPSEEPPADPPASGSATSAAPAAEPSPDIPAVDPARFAGITWTAVATDPQGDGANPSLADGAAVSYHHEAGADTLWFRIELHDLPDASVFGTNLVIDTDGDASNGAAWWGANSDFNYDRLVTAWVVREGDGFGGTIGIGDAEGASRRSYTNLMENNLALGVDEGVPAIYLGVPTADLGSPGSFRVVTAVGSNQSWNDDIPDSGSGTVELSGM